MFRLLLLHDDHEPVAMRCSGCGQASAFDVALPYINQTASFLTGHGCTALLRPAEVELPA